MMLLLVFQCAIIANACEEHVVVRRATRDVLLWWVAQGWKGVLLLYADTAYISYNYERR